MKAIKVIITRFIDSHQPGFIECKFTDAYGQLHIVHDKVPIVTAATLNANSQYPQHGEIKCKVLKEWENNIEQKIYSVTTSVPISVETIDGVTEFDLLESHLIDASYL
jgi:hypothetical protein